MKIRKKIGKFIIILKIIISFNTSVNISPTDKIMVVNINTTIRVK